MAKKRLNRKIALIGSAFSAVVILSVIVLFLYLSRNPLKFLKDGDAMMQSAQQTSDPNQLKDLYSKAERNYRRAYGRAKTDELKIVSLYKLTDLFKAKGQWRDVVGCWSNIVHLDKNNLQARYSLLKYLYIVAQASPGLVWQDIASQSSEFIDILEKPGVSSDLASMDTSKWDIDALKQKDEPVHRLIPYLHLIRGRANFETAKLGLVTNKEETLKLAITDLEKVKQLEPDNIDVYFYLAQASALQGNIEALRGNVEGQKKNQEDALATLKQGIEASKDSITANINMLQMKHFFSESSQEPNLQKRLLSMEPDYLALEKKFGSNPEMSSALASYYGDYRLGSTYLNKAIDLIEQALKLDPNNVDYAVIAANLYSRRYNMHSNKADLVKADEICRKGLLMPDAQDMTGPRAAVARTYQVQLNSLLALNNLGEIWNPAEPLKEGEGQKILEDTQQAVRQMEQLYGSGDNPQVIKWQGMVELAEATLNKKDTSAAIRKLYNIHTQLKASGQSDPSLSYCLAKTFQRSSESGAVGEFISDSIINGIEMLHPEARLDFADLLIAEMNWRGALFSLDVFEQQCGVTDKSRIMRITINIIGRDFAEAERILEQIPQQDPNWIQLKFMAQAGKCRQLRNIIDKRAEKPKTGIVLQKILTEGAQPQEIEQRTTEQLMSEMKSDLADLIGRMDVLFEKDPNMLGNSTIASLCEDAIATGQLDSAGMIVEKYLKHDPENTTGLYYRQILKEPVPAKVSLEKRNHIREEVISAMTDPAKRALGLGAFYQMNNEPNKAAEQFKKLAGLSTGGETLKTDDMARRLATGMLFDIVLEKKDWETVDKIVQIAKKENIDNCSGDFFAARSAIAREQYESALASIDSALAQKPVFAYGYLIRSRINASLGKEDSALSDARTAATINPMDRTIAKELANRLYTRNQKLGGGASSAQLTETRIALNQAMALNPGDTALLSFYAEYISDSDPERALALRQSLQENAPSVQNALLLARMATKLGVDSSDPQRKQALLGMASSALDQAKSKDPQNPAVLDSIAEFYRQTDREKDAEKLLIDSKDPRMLARHYIKEAQYDEAKKVYEKMYAENPKDVNTIRGLLYIAEKTSDKDAVKKLSDPLLAADDSSDNVLLIVQTFLNVGLVNDAELKLASFREKHPADGKGLLLGAWLAMKKGDLTEAMDLTNKRLESDQKDSTAWRLRGNLNYMTANYDQAIMDLKQSKNLLDAPETRMLLARTYLRTKRTEDAITELRAIAEDPQTPDEARLLLEDIYIRTGRKEQAKDFYAKVLEKMPESVFWHSRAGSFDGATNDLPAAEQEFAIALTKAKEQNQLNVDALAGYLKALLLQAKYEKLIDEAGKYIDTNLASIAYMRMAEAKVKIGDRVTAVQYAKKAVEKSPNDDVYISLIQNMNELLGNADVEAMCNQTLTGEPASYKANMGLYLIYKEKGEYNKALDYIENCLKATTPGQPRWVYGMTQKAESQILNSYKTSDKNFYKEAIKTYESLLEKMPTNTYVLNNTAYLLADNDQDIDKALGYAKSACELRPEDPGYIDTYAFVLFKKGQYADAIRYSQASLQQYEAQRIPPPAVAYEHLGQSLEKNSGLSQARAAYEQALEAGGENLDKATKDRLTAAIERIKNSK